MITAPRTITNSSQRKKYETNWGPIRPGSNDHEKIPSRMNNSLRYRDGKVEKVSHG